RLNSRVFSFIVTNRLELRLLHTEVVLQPSRHFLPLLRKQGEEVARSSHHFVFDICVNLCYPSLMKQIITAKLKLQTDHSQFAALRHTQLAYRDALNYVS